MRRTASATPSPTRARQPRADSITTSDRRCPPEFRPGVRPFLQQGDRSEAGRQVAGDHAHQTGPHDDGLRVPVRAVRVVRVSSSLPLHPLLPPAVVGSCPRPHLATAAAVPSGPRCAGLFVAEEPPRSGVTPGPPRRPRRPPGGPRPPPRSGPGAPRPAGPRRGSRRTGWRCGYPRCPGRCRARAREPLSVTGLRFADAATPRPPASAAVRSLRMSP